MNKLKLLFVIILLFAGLQLHAQTLYVDAVNGKDVAIGTQTTPLFSIEKAVEIANSIKATKHITIKLAPGLYMLSKIIVTKSLPPNQTETNCTPVFLKTIKH